MDEYSAMLLNISGSTGNIVGWNAKILNDCLGHFKYRCFYRSFPRHKKMVQSG